MCQHSAVDPYGIRFSISQPGHPDGSGTSTITQGQVRAFFRCVVDVKFFAYWVSTIKIANGGLASVMPAVYDRVDRGGKQCLPDRRGFLSDKTEVQPVPACQNIDREPRKSGQEPGHLQARECKVNQRRC